MSGGIFIGGQSSSTKMHYHWNKGIGCLLTLLLLSSCSREPDESVVVYTSQDQVYAAEILRDFTIATGIEVLPLYDSESVKTTGLVNRLVAEKKKPRCDVFWSNEEMMVRRLARRSVLEEGSIRSFGYRTRRLVINTNRVATSEIPKSLGELVAPRWRGRVVMAYPLYGTTLTHLMALRAAWGTKDWQAWCRKLISNECKVVDGNSAVVALVGRGDAWIGLTDSDDVGVGRNNGWPIRALALAAEFPTIANSAALVKEAPHRRNGEILLDYLSDDRTVNRLVEMGALEGTMWQAGGRLEPDWPRVLEGFEEAFDWLGETFFR